MGDQTRNGKPSDMNGLALGAAMDKLVDIHGLLAVREEVRSKFNNILV